MGAREKLSVSEKRYSEAKKAANKKWDGANLDRISVALPAGTKEKIKARAEAMGESVNGYLNRLVLADLENSRLIEAVRGEQHEI